MDRWHSQRTGDGEGMLSEQNVYKAQGPENASELPMASPAGEWPPNGDAGCC